MSFKNPFGEERFAKADEMRMDELLTVEEVAQWLKVPKSWVYDRTRFRGSGRLPFIKLGKYVRFEAGAIRAFLERTRHGGPGTSDSTVR